MAIDTLQPEEMCGFCLRNEMAMAMVSPLGLNAHNPKLHRARDALNLLLLDADKAGDPPQKAVTFFQTVSLSMCSSWPLPMADLPPTLVRDLPR